MEVFIKNIYDIIYKLNFYKITRLNSTLSSKFSVNGKIMLLIKVLYILLRVY